MDIILLRPWQDQKLRENDGDKNYVKKHDSSARNTSSRSSNKSSRRRDEGQLREHQDTKNESHHKKTTQHLRYHFTHH